MGVGFEPLSAGRIPMEQRTVRLFQDRNYTRAGRKLELGLVPLGSIGMSVFALDLYFAGVPTADANPAGALLSLGEFLGIARSWRIVSA